LDTRQKGIYDFADELLTIFGREGRYSLGALMKIDPASWVDASRDNQITIVA